MSNDVKGYYLAYRTDSPEAFIGLYSAETVELISITWEAHRTLSDEILHKTMELLEGKEIELRDLSGIGVFSGPGSFTGLRISHAVANALAYSLDIPVHASGSENWIAESIESCERDPSNRIVTPDYGRDARITKPRK